MSSLKDQLKQDAEELGVGGSDFFKFENKKTSKFRVLTELKALGQHFFGVGQKPSVCYGVKKGCPFHGIDPNSQKGEEYKLSTKYIAYVLDADGKIKLAELPYTVVKAIGDLEEDEDYKFSGFPMPYDIKVAFDKDLSPTEMYKVTPSPTRSAVTDDTMGELAGLMGKNSPEHFVEVKKEKQVIAHKASGHWLSPEVLEKREADRKAKFLEGLEDDKKKNAGKSQDEMQGYHYPTPEEEGMTGAPFGDDEAK